MRLGLRGLAMAGVTLLLAGTLVACGYHRHYDDPEKRLNWMVEEVTKELDLNEQQQSKLTLFKSELSAIATQLHGERDAVHNTVTELLSQPTLDQTRLTNLITQKTAFVNEHTPALVTALAGFYDSLTPEQQTKIRDGFEDHYGSRCHFWSR